MSPPRTWSGGRWRRWARSPWCPGAVGAWRRAALEALGGYPSDTLAEDQDLTIAGPARRLARRVRSRRARLHRGAGDGGGALEPALPLVVRHPAVPLEAPRRRTFDRKHAGARASSPCRRSGCSRSSWPPPRRWSIWRDLEPGLGRRTTASITRCEAGQRTSSSGRCFYWAIFIFVDLSAAALGMALEKRAPWSDTALDSGPALRLPPAHVLRGGQGGGHRRPRLRGSAGASSNGAPPPRWSSGPESSPTSVRAIQRNFRSSEEAPLRRAS